jgi:hypothetical protein
VLLRQSREPAFHAALAKQQSALTTALKQLREPALQAALAKQRSALSQVALSSPVSSQFQENPWRGALEKALTEYRATSEESDRDLQVNLGRLRALRE